MNTLHLKFFLLKITPLSKAHMYVVIGSDETLQSGRRNHQPGVVHRIFESTFYFLTTACNLGLFHVQNDTW